MIKLILSQQIYNNSQHLSYNTQHNLLFNMLHNNLLYIIYDKILIAFETVRLRVVNSNQRQVSISSNVLTA